MNDKPRFMLPEPTIISMRWLSAKPYIAATILALAGALVAQYIGFDRWVSGIFLALAVVSIAFIIGAQGDPKPPKMTKGNYNATV